MLFIAVLIPCFYPDILDLFGLLGGLTIGTSGYTIPFLLKLSSLHKVHYLNPTKLFYLLLLLLVLFLSISSVVLSITHKGEGPSH